MITKIKMQLSFELKKWMALAALGFVLFVLSYLMAETMPDCPTCTAHGDASTVQFFHFCFGVVCGLGSVVAILASVLDFFEEWN